MFKYIVAFLMLIFECSTVHAGPVIMNAYKDLDFISGESGVVLDLQADLIVENNGQYTDTSAITLYNPSNWPIDFQVSSDGIDYNPVARLFSCQALPLPDSNIRYVKFSYAGYDAGYQVFVFTNQTSGSLTSGCINARLRDEDDNLAEFDTVGSGEDGVGYPVVINMEHHKLHEGWHFECQEDDQDVDDVKYFLIKAPDTATRIHYLFNMRSSLNGTVEFFRSPTFTDSGTTLTAYNNDDNSTNEASLLLWEDPTITDTGPARKLVNIIGSDGLNPNGSQGGFTNRSNEEILGQGLYYLIVYTPESSNQRINKCSSWYEVVPE